MYYALLMSTQHMSKQSKESFKESVTLNMWIVHGSELTFMSYSYWTLPCIIHLPLVDQIVLPIPFRNWFLFITDGVQNFLVYDQSILRLRLLVCVNILMILICKFLWNHCKPRCQRNRYRSLIIQKMVTSR